MGSRFGNVVTVTGLFDQLKSIISDKYLTTGYSKDEKENIAEKVAQGALKYAFLKNSIGSDFIFDINASVSLEGNSGPYLQYTYARTQSVLAKSGRVEEWKSGSKEGVIASEAESDSADAKQSFSSKILSNPLNSSKSENKWKMVPGKWKIEKEELSLLRTFLHYPEVVESAAQNYAPNMICNYLYDLAQKFNTFYNAHKILVDDPLILELRLKLTSATGTILKNGLNLLGISAPERM